MVFVTRTGNVPRIKQKIGESEDESKAPGAKYLKDILRATAYYFKYDMLKCLDDLKLFVEAKKGQIVKFVTKTNPFSIMIVTQLKNEILCEYQIKMKDAADLGDEYRRRDKYNHLMYEFERAETVQDLINALTFTAQNLRQKLTEDGLKAL